MLLNDDNLSITKWRIEQTLLFSDYKDLGHKVLCGIAALSYTKADWTNHLYRAGRSFQKRKRNFFFLYLSGSLCVLSLQSEVRFFWLTQHLAVPPTSNEAAEWGLTVWGGKQQLSRGVSEGELSEMGPIIGSFLSEVNMPKQGALIRNCPHGQRTTNEFL